MAALTASTTPTQLPDPWSDLQNLGSVDVYLGNDSTVSSSTGVKISPGGSYTRPGRVRQGVWVVAASGTADVRYIA